MGALGGDWKLMEGWRGGWTVPVDTTGVYDFSCERRQQ